MALLGWVCVLAVTIAAVLFGQTARPRQSAGPLPSRVRTGIAVSITGPLLVAAVGLVVATVSGAWLTAATGTVAAVSLTVVTGLVLVPGVGQLDKTDPLPTTTRR